MKLKKYNCRHCAAGRAHPALTAKFYITNGDERSVGSVCTNCISEWGLDGLTRWGSHLIGEACVWQPSLGKVKISIQAAPGGAVSDGWLASLLEYLEEIKLEKARSIEMIGRRARLPQASALEMAGCITLEGVLLAYPDR